MKLPRSVAHLVVGLLELAVVAFVTAAITVIAAKIGVANQGGQPLLAIPFAGMLLAVALLHKRIVDRLAPLPESLMDRMWREATEGKIVRRI